MKIKDRQQDTIKRVKERKRIDEHRKKRYTKSDVNSMNSLLMEVHNILYGQS